MDIKDSYLHGTVGVVKSISVSADKLKYTLADIAGTVREVTLPVATQTANGLLSKEDKKKLDNMIATKVANDLILKINSGTTEGTSLYTYNGSSDKTLDIKSGTGIGFTNNAGLLQIYNSGVRSIATGTTNGTISVNTNGTSKDVAVKGLGSAAYTSSNAYVKWNSSSDAYYNITQKSNITDGYVRVLYNNVDNISVFGYGYNPTTEVCYITNYKKDYNLVLADSLYYRNKIIAYTDSNITGNAATADKLKTKRKLWGQDFDGSADVSGDMTGVRSIIRSEENAVNTDSLGNLKFKKSDTFQTWSIQNYDSIAKFVVGENGNTTVAGYVQAASFMGNIDGTYVNKLTGYAKATSAADLAATDTLNAALGKLEYKADTAYDWYKSVTGTDNDDIINKWEEIVGFIDSVKEGTDITDEFVTRKTQQEITASKTFRNSDGIYFRAGNYGLRLVGNGEYGYLQLGQIQSDGTKVHKGKITGIFAESLSSLEIRSRATTATGTFTATKFITSGGTSSQFVKGDGSLDSTAYATTTSLGNYVTLNTVQTITGSKTFTATTNTFSGTGASILTIDRNSTNPAWIRFCKNGTLLGYIGIDNSYNPTYLSGESGAVQKIILHSGNYISYLPILNSSSTHATSSSVIYAPTTAGTSGQILVSNGSGAPVWVNQSSISAVTSKVLRNYYSSRQTTIKPGITGDGSMIQYKSTSTCTDTDKPGEGHILHFNWDNNGGWDSQLCIHTTTPNLSTRCMNSGTWSEWARVITSLNYTSYLGYIGTTAVQSSAATQSLTGIGDIHMAGDIIITTGDTDKCIYFDYDGNKTAGASWRTGMLGSGSGDTNYFVIQSGTSDTSTTTWTNTIRISQNTYDIAISGNLYPLLNNSKTLGTSSLKWSNVYATTFTGNLSGNATTASSAAKWTTARTLTVGNLAKTVDGSANVSWPLHDILLSSTQIGTSTSWDIYTPGVYYVASSSAFTGTGNPESTNGGITPYRYGQLIISKAGNGGVAQFYISHCDSKNTDLYGIKFRTGWNNTYLGTWESILDTSNYTYYTVTKTGTGATGTWNISISGNAASASTSAKLSSSTAISAKEFSLSNTSWTDTGYTFANLASGTYAVQITSGTNLVASGIMSVYKNLSDTAGDEIPLHVYGTAGWRPYLRTYANKLQISSNDTSSTKRTVTIKIAQIL